MTVEILLDNPAFERVALVYKQSLERLGIAVTIRTVDTAQFQKREDDRDFDLILYGAGAVAVARQRAARILGLGGGRPSRDRRTFPASRTPQSMC